MCLAGTERTLRRETGTAWHTTGWPSLKAKAIERLRTGTQTTVRRRALVDHARSTRPLFRDQACVADNCLTILMVCFSLMPKMFRRTKISEDQISGDDVIAACANLSLRLLQN
jgi:hypothetical protein